MAEHNHAVRCGACDEILERERAAHDAAEARNRATREFLLVIAHELRGRLNAITGWAGVLRGQLSAGDDSAERALATIERNAWAQVHIIEEMLAEVQAPEVSPRASLDAASARTRPDAEKPRGRRGFSECAQRDSNSRPSDP